MAIEKEQGKTEHQGSKKGIDSPFLDEEVFGDKSTEVSAWELHIDSHQLESPFLHAFETEIQEVESESEDEETGKFSDELDREDLEEETEKGDLSEFLAYEEEGQEGIRGYEETLAEEHADKFAEERSEQFDETAGEQGLEEFSIDEKEEPGSGELQDELDNEEIETEVEGEAKEETPSVTSQYMEFTNERQAVSLSDNESSGEHAKPSGYEEFSDAQMEAESFKDSEFGIDSSGKWSEEISSSSQDYIRWTQNSLNKILGLNLAVDGIMGQQTRNAIRSFQKKLGLTVDGIPGSNTIAALLAITGTPAISGMANLGKGEIVFGTKLIRWMQMALNRLLGLNLKVDGISGSQTKMAIQTFQQKQGIAKTGTLDSTTLVKSLSILANVKQGSACSRIKPTEILDEFEKAQAEVPRKHYPIIGRICLCISESRKTNNPILDVSLSGHASIEGDQEFNRSLGKSRAQRVALIMQDTLKKMAIPSVIDGQRLGNNTVSIQTTTEGSSRPRGGQPEKDRRVEVSLPIVVEFPPDPIPPKPPVEEETFLKRIDRILRIVNAKGLNPPVRTRRARCMLEKMRQPGVLDIFVDGTLNNQTINKHHVIWWICSWAGNYDPPQLSQADMRKFFSSVGAILRGPGFAPTQPDEEILYLVGQIIKMITHGIVRVERYVTLQTGEAYAGDRTRIILKNTIAANLQNENSIYSCFRDYTGGEWDTTDIKGGYPHPSPTPPMDPQQAY